MWPLLNVLNISVTILVIYTPPPFTSTLGCWVIPKFLHSHGLINLGLIRVFNPHDQENILSVLGDTYFLFASLSQPYVPFKHITRHDFRTLLCSSIK